MEFILLFTLIFIFIFSFFLMLFLYLLSFFLSFKCSSKMKLSSYECGFTSVKKAGSGFNLVFFSIVLLFVIFELEVIVFIMLIWGDVYCIVSFFVFFMYVVISYYIEFFFYKMVWFF